MSYDEFNIFAVENILTPMGMSSFTLEEAKSLPKPTIVTNSLNKDLSDSMLKDLLSRHVDRSIDYKKIRRQIVEEYGEDSWREPEYDLEEVTTVLDVEVYVKRAYKKRLAHMFKEGFFIDGLNKRNVEYVEKRLSEIAFFTNISTLELFKDMARDFLTKSNTVVVKERRRGLGSGLPRRSLDGRRLNPIVGYFVVDPSFVEAQFDKWGNVKKYRVFASDRGHYRDFDLNDVIHLTREKKYSEWCGTPDMVSIAPDIATLRQIEENIELYFYQHLFPLYQYKVGTKDQDAALYPDGTREIDIVRQEIQYMPTEGCIVTPFRHEIQPLDTKARFSAIKDIHDIFKKRLFAALGMSDIDFGEGNCHDETTQTLTEFGWKYHHEIDHTTTRIASYNPVTSSIEFKIPNYKYTGVYKGDMLKFGGKHFDALVTPHHEMWVKPRWGKDTSWRKEYAYDLYNGKYSEFCMLDSAPLSANDDTQVFHLDGVKAVRGKSPKGVDCSIDDFAAFLGWFISEGCLDKYNGERGFYRLVISQNYGDNYQKIANVLNAIGVTWSVSGRTDRPLEKSFKIYGKTLYKFLEAHVGHTSENKNIPSFVFEWPVSARLNMLDSLMCGDGTISDSGHKTYYTKSKQLADDVQRLCMSVNMSAKVVKNDYENVYRVSIYNNGSRYITPNMISKVSYEGVIYCYNVDNNLFVTRRNGKTLISGNTTTRASANTLSLQLIDDVKDDLHTLEDLIQKEFFTELLLEAPFAYNPFKKEECVKLVFPDPDKEGKIQALKAYTEAADKNVINLDEAREEIGKKPYTREAWKTTAWMKFQKEEIKLAHPANTTTVTEAHTKDDSTPDQRPMGGSPSGGGKSPSKGKPAAPKPVKPKPKVTTTTKAVQKSTLMDLYESLWDGPSKFDDAMVQIPYYITDDNKAKLVKDFFESTKTMLKNAQTDDDLVSLLVGRKVLFEGLLDEYIVNEELVLDDQR